MNVLNAVVQMCIDPLTIEAVAVEEDQGEAEVNFADGGGIVQIVPLRRKTRQPRLKMRLVGRRGSCKQQKSE